MISSRLKSLLRSTTLAQRFVVHTRARKLARTHLEGVVPEAPRRIVVEPTNACNLGCSYCGNKDMLRPNTYLKMEHFEKLLDQMVELGIPRMTLHTIGEPLLHPQIAEMVAKAKERKRIVTISTNGSLLTEEKARALVEAGPDILNISADAGDAETLAKTRDGLDFEVLIAGLRRLRKFRDEVGPIIKGPWGEARMPNLTITCVITPLFTREVERKFFEAYGPLVDDFQFHWPNNHGNYVPDEPLRKRGLIPHRIQDAIFRMIREPCHYPWDALFLLSDGTMSVCRFDFDARIKVGRFPDKSLLELWNSEEMRSLRRAHISFNYDGWEQCRDCSATFYENRHKHFVVTQRLKKRNGFETKRDIWLSSNPMDTQPEKVSNGASE